jgi:hypothetical protein
VAYDQSRWKPTISIIPFAVIMFECTILGGALATFAALIFNCGLPAFGLDKSLHDPRMTDESFGIVFTKASTADIERITALLSDTGAVEVTTGDDTVYEVPNA